jgi:hypothetical protein
MNARRVLVALSVPVLVLLVPGSVRPMGCFSPEPLTLREEAASPDARAILVCTFRTAPGAKSSELEIHTVLRSLPCLKGKKKIPLDRLVPAGPQEQFIVFFDLEKGKLSPYRGVPITRAASIGYLQRVLALPAKDVSARLGLFFGHLDDPDPAVSDDAFREFTWASGHDILRAGPRFSADKLRTRLKNPKTPPHRLGVYSLLLGACGKPRDARLLRKLLDSKDGRRVKVADKMLAGYTTLEPKAGWKYIQDSLKDTKEEFLFRYAALRAVRFLHDYRPDLVAKKDLVDAVCVLLKQDDMADLGIEDLRKWACWDKAAQVLAVRKTDAYKQPIVRRALLRYCLACEGNAAAKAYVAQCRKADPEEVEEAEELLELEREKAKPGKK